MKRKPSNGTFRPIRGWKTSGCVKPQGNGRKGVNETPPGCLTAQNRAEDGGGLDERRRNRLHGGRLLYTSPKSKFFDVLDQLLPVGNPMGRLVKFQSRNVLTWSGRQRALLPEVENLLHKGRSSRSP